MIFFNGFFSLATVNSAREWASLAQRSRVVMGNLDFSYTIQKMCSETRYKKNGIVPWLQSLIYIFILSCLMMTPTPVSAKESVGSDSICYSRSGRMS